MKRIISAILTVAMILMFGTVAFAAEATAEDIAASNYQASKKDEISASNGSEGTNTLYYNGISVSSADLSETTVSWLGWYNSLDSDEQLAINYVPEELSLLSANLARLNSTDVLLSRLGAPVYNPSYWNDSSSTL